MSSYKQAFTKKCLDIQMGYIHNTDSEWSSLLFFFNWYPSYCRKNEKNLLRKLFLKFMLKIEVRLSRNCSLSLSLFHLKVVCWKAVFCIWRWTRIYFNKNKQSKNPDNSEALILVCSSLDMETISLNKIIYTFWIQFLEIESWGVEDGADFLNLENKTFLVLCLV